MQAPDTAWAWAHLRRLTKFGLTGCAGFAVDFGTLVALHSGLRWPLGWSTLAAYTLGGIVHYGLTRLWVFAHQSQGREASKLLRYLLLGALNAVATLVIVSALTWIGLDYRLAKILAVIGLFFTNYALTPKFVMRSPGSLTVAPRSNADSKKVR